MSESSYVKFFLVFIHPMLWAQAGCDIRLILFKWSKAGLNLEFPSPRLVAIPKLKGCLLIFVYSYISVPIIYFWLIFLSFYFSCFWYVFTNSFPMKKRSIFKWNKSGLNSESSFSKTDCIFITKESCLHNYLPIAQVRNTWIHTFSPQKTTLLQNSMLD